MLFPHTCTYCRPALAIATCIYKQRRSRAGNYFLAIHSCTTNICANYTQTSTDITRDTNKAMARSVILNVDLGKDPSITSEAGFYCMEYIISKSTQLDLHCSIRTSKHRTIAQKYKKTSQKIQEVGGILEHFYPHLFSCQNNMAWQFSGLPLTSQTAVCDLFKLLTKELFKTGLNWSRVVVLFVFAGALAVDCIRRSKTEFLKTIIYCVKQCVDDTLLEWIRENGGWVS